ncbi:hypothetical protein QFZ56_007851 [Streptomyces achromogenes]|uniref:Uncharacterized protein n=1 Tax=Streptomyces achromogenes TaxID=67255 RepID=A0ABU0QGN3_STRAH|nr:hypothetical protein [Streptomyces achromogenes]MDQ0688888.1 hypothetical protein [Streptomyces achromogenes]
MQDQVQAKLAAMQAEREAARAEETTAAIALNEGYLADYRAGHPPRDEATAAAYREWQQLDAEDRQEAAEARGLEDEHRSADADKVTAATTDTGPQQEGTESWRPGVPDSQSTGTAREEAPVAPAGTTADAPARRTQTVPHPPRVTVRLPTSPSTPSVRRWKTPCGPISRSLPHREPGELASRSSTPVDGGLRPLRDLGASGLDEDDDRADE